MAGGRPNLPVPAHGTRARYQHRREPCRCPACTGANNSYMAVYRRAPERAETPPRRNVHGTQLTIPGTAARR